MGVVEGAMSDSDGTLVIAQVSSDLWWGPALMAAVGIICTAGAMSIRSVRWGRSSSKEEPRSVQERQRVRRPLPVDPPGFLPPPVVPDASSEAGGSEDGDPDADGAPLGPLDWARGFGVPNMWDEVGADGESVPVTLDCPGCGTRAAHSQ